MEEGSPAREKAQRTGRERLKRVESEEAVHDVVQIYASLSLTLNLFLFVTFSFCQSYGGMFYQKEKESGSESERKRVEDERECVY